MDAGLIKNKQGLTEAQFLAAYDPHKWERPSVTVDMLVFTVTDSASQNYRKLPEKVLKLLLIKRGDHPGIGKWALPGGFVDINESLDAAALRELKEETNIANIYLEQLYTWGDLGRDPRTRIISTAYMALIDSSALDVRAADDAAEAAWFTVSCKLQDENKTVTRQGYSLNRSYKLILSGNAEVISADLRIVKTREGNITRVERDILKSDRIAFDHAKIIQYGLERLRNKIEYTDIAFNLMPELFTLTDLQQVYEVILDTPLLKANFRRKIADRVTETGQFTRYAGHRPSRLFRFNSGWIT
jgi:8-oxo-dGTP diphosphatase